MADEENTSPEEQALADEWAAALAEAGDAGQEDIDAMLAEQEAPTPEVPRAPMEEFGSTPVGNQVAVSLDGPNLDVILDIPVSISMEVGNTDITIRNCCNSTKARSLSLIVWPVSRWMYWSTAP